MSVVGYAGGELPQRRPRSAKSRPYPHRQPEYQCLQLWALLGHQEEIIFRDVHETYDKIAQHGDVEILGAFVEKLMDDFLHNCLMITIPCPDLHISIPQWFGGCDALEAAGNLGDPIHKISVVGAGCIHFTGRFYCSEADVSWADGHFDDFQDYFIWQFVKVIWQLHNCCRWRLCLRSSFLLFVHTPQWLHHAPSAKNFTRVLMNLSFQGFKSWFVTCPCT